MSFFISGKNNLNGTIRVETSKNALLPIIAASVLADSPVTLVDVPKFSDVINMCKILENLGVTVCWDDDRLTIDPSTIDNSNIDMELSQKIRASIFLIGPLCAKFKTVTAYMPGGCKIGSRPIDIHLNGLKTLGVDIMENNGEISIDASHYAGGVVSLRIPSVGATENLIMSAVLQNKIATTIKNCAKEPEIIDLCKFLNLIGAKITGAGTKTIKIIGVNKLGGCKYKVIGDRIIAGTYMIACAMCGGNIKLENANIHHNKSLIAILSNLGCLVVGNSDNIYIVSSGLKHKSINVITKPYPGFATDLQSQLISLLSIVRGRHVVIETLFENRFNQVAELVKMGAQITVCNNIATIIGRPDCYKGNEVVAKDLRGGAALILAGLAAHGNTIVNDIEYIDRGYEKIEEKLSNIGADIHRT